MLKNCFFHWERRSMITWQSNLHLLFNIWKSTIWTSLPASIYVLSFYDAFTIRILCSGMFFRDTIWHPFEQAYSRHTLASFFRVQNYLQTMRSHPVIHLVFVQTKPKSNFYFFLFKLEHPWHTWQENLQILLQPLFETHLTVLRSNHHLKVHGTWGKGSFTHQTAIICTSCLSDSYDLANFSFLIPTQNFGFPRENCCLCSPSARFFSSISKRKFSQHVYFS